MTTNIFDRFLLLERSGNAKANTSVFEMRLNGKKLHVRHGNKGQKLQKKIYKKQSISEAIGLFNDKKKQKINDGYRIITEQTKNNNNNNTNSTPNLPISGKSIQNPNKQNNTNKSMNSSQQSQSDDDQSQQSHGRIKHGKQQRQNKHRKHSGKQIHKQKHLPNGASGKHKKKHKRQHHAHQKSESSNASEYIDDDKENNYQIANGYSQEDTPGTDDEYESNINSEEDDTEYEDDDTEQEEQEEQEEEASESDDESSSVQSGRSSDAEYEMDYEKMSDVMYSAFNKEIDLNTLQWKPIKLWIRFNEYNDLNGEYALAPQCKRIAGSCHELLVIYIRSKSNDSGYNDTNVIYKRLLKLARDPEEDNKHHFDSERYVSQYLHKIAKCINNNLYSRYDVCIWPVETILFEYRNELKYATIQTPFLPDKSSNNIFVKIEPNSGKPCVNDAIVGRYQHLFSSITRGLDLIRDWQGYGVTQEIFLNVCKKYNVQYEAMDQIKVRKNKRLQSQTQVLIVIDPVLTTYNAHYFTNNPTDFGIKAMDEWIQYHNCTKCRCKYLNLLPIDDMQFGFADPKQLFFDIENIDKNVYNNIQKCRYNLNIYQGDDFKIDDSDDI